MFRLKDKRILTTDNGALRSDDKFEENKYTDCVKALVHLPERISCKFHFV